MNTAKRKNKEQITSIPRLIEEIRKVLPDASIRDVMKHSMRMSIPAFALTCFPNALKRDLANMHYELCNLLQSDHDKIGVAFPREHGKSTWATYIYPLWKIMNKRPDEGMFIVIISESRDQSINFISRIKSALDGNEKLRQYYGDFGSRTAQRWREGDIILKNGARVLAMGTGQKIRGQIQEDSRPTVLIVDDFESELNTVTAEARFNNRKWILDAVIPSLAEGGRTILIGTTVHEDCFLQWVKDAPMWKVLWKAIVDENDEPEWPERWSKKKIAALKAEAEHFGNLSGFYQERMNQAQSPDDAPFKPEFMVTYSGDLTKKDGRWWIHTAGEDRLLNVYMGVDLASSLAKRADYTVLATIGKDSEGNEYLLDLIRGKSNPALHPQMIVDAFKKWRHQGVFIESQAYQESCRQHVRQIMLDEGIHIPGIERKITSRTSKSERLLSLVPLFAQHRFKFRSGDLQAQREFLAFPRGKNDDIIDAIWFASNFGKKPLASRNRTGEKARKRKKTTDNWMTA